MWVALIQGACLSSDSTSGGMRVRFWLMMCLVGTYRVRSALKAGHVEEETQEMARKINESWDTQAAELLRLKECRKAAGYASAADFARVIGMPEKTYRNYERGDVVMSVNTAWMFADMLGCTVDDIIGRV